MRPVGLLALLAALVATPGVAATISNPIAAFSGLDKITGRITNFDVYMDETVQFGALQITPRVCYTRPPTETQRTSVFLEVDQVSLKGGSQRIFTGWMFADSPALNAIDHPVYDIWLVDCKQTSDTPPPEKTNPEPGDTSPSAAPPAAEPAPAAAPPSSAPAAEAPAPPDAPPPLDLTAPVDTPTDTIPPADPTPDITSIAPAQ